MPSRSSPIRGSASANSTGSHRTGGALVPALLAPLVVGGAALLVAQAKWLRRVVSNDDDGLARVQRLNRAILGNGKHAIASVLGPPQASAGVASPNAIFLANTWYYRLDARHRIAIAITFRDDVACDVRVLRLQPTPASAVKVCLE